MSRFRRHHFTTLPSTQDEARQRCETQQAQPGDVIHADIQTSGYGRRGRAWQSQTGNLSCTLIETAPPRALLSCVPYAMSLGIYDAIAPLLKDAASLTIKWPNDLFLHDGKLAGMLLEKTGDWLLIGVGVNVAHAPETDRKTAALNEYSATPVTAAALLPALLQAYDHWLQKAATGGFKALKDTWLARSGHHAGAPMTARLADHSVLQGEFHDLDASGALLLRDYAGKIHSITAADIFANMAA